MAVLTVRKYGDGVLRRRATAVREITPEIRRMIADMVDTMYDEVGIGLAAPQVGIGNPVITEQGGEVTSEEGLEGQDLEGKPVSNKALAL